MTTLKFMECILLWPLHITLWFSCGLAIPRTVPSINPKQLPNRAPRRLVDAYDYRR